MHAHLPPLPSLLLLSPLLLSLLLIQQLPLWLAAHLSCPALLQVLDVPQQRVIVGNAGVCSEGRVHFTS